MTIPSPAAPDGTFADGTFAPHGSALEPARPALHGSFTLVVEVEARVADVYAAVVQGQTRRRWLRLPGRAGPDPGQDYRVDASETLHSVISLDGSDQSIERHTHVLDLVPDRRLVLTYRAVVDGVCRWISLVTLELEALREAGTSLTWTEQYAFLVVTGDGADDVAHLRGATRFQLNGLALALGAGARPAVEH